MEKVDEYIKLSISWKVVANHIFSHGKQSIVTVRKWTKGSQKIPTSILHWIQGDNIEIRKQIHQRQRDQTSYNTYCRKKKKEELGDVLSETDIISHYTELSSDHID